MDNEIKDSEECYKKLLEKILENQKKIQNLLKVIIVLLLAIIVIKLFVTG